MSKKIAILLIMIMFVNMTAWTDTGLDTNTEGTILLVIGILTAIVCLTLLFVFVEANTPEDNTRLASMQTEASLQKNFHPLVNILSHIEFAQTRDNNIYMGLRFRF